MDWKKAEEYLKSCEQAYSGIGTAGIFALNIVIMPLRDRFNRGERTAELYADIMDIKL